MQDLGKTATDALKSSGVDPSVVNSTTKTVTATADTVVSTTKPLVNQLVTFVTTTEPVVLGEYALAGLVLYLVGPTLLGVVAGAARGYAGELTAAAALDQVCNDGNTVIVDIRTTREKEATGIPDLPVRDRLVELDYATIDDRRVCRGVLCVLGVCMLCFVHYVHACACVLAACCQTGCWGRLLTVFINSVVCMHDSHHHFPPTCLHSPPHTNPHSPPPHPHFPAHTLLQIRGALRNPAAVEASITAMQVAALKRVSKGTNVLLLDRYGGDVRWCVCRMMCRMM